jgi:pseudaminic acid cytidylyltransferase
MLNICIIPARGGSKRIPRKNIKDFLGKPIIAYSIQAALQCNLFDEVMVSTDDEEIVEIAKQYGAKVPFVRSKKNSDDYAGTVDVILEVLLEYEKQQISFENICCLYPTAPFVTAELMEEGYHMLTQKNYNSVFPVCAFSFPILRALQLSTEQQVSMIWPENMAKRSQDLPPAYHDAGQFYWCRTTSLISENKLYTNNSGAVILSELNVQDIDNESDWKLAELKYKIQNEDSNLN